jgi:membrane protein DedA with SNARE-associated domain
MEQRMLDDNGTPRPTPEYLLVEYKAAQDSAQHHDTLIWSITSVVWGASLLMLGFLLGRVSDPSLKHIVVLISALGILLNVKVWIYTYQLSSVKIQKYDRCKAIERQLGLQQHSTLRYPAGRQKVLYSIVMVLFIILWIVVACPCILTNAVLP